MARLIINPNAPARFEANLSRGVLSIGRDPGNDLVLPDAMVSRRHAVVEYRAGHYSLRDCNSSNGSMVNGDRVFEHTLRDGDVVAIGTARLLFRDDPVRADAAGKVLQHPAARRLLCPECETAFRPGDSFCRQCGRQLEATPALPGEVCPRCAAPLTSRHEHAVPGVRREGQVEWHCPACAFERIEPLTCERCAT